MPETAVYFNRNLLLCSISSLSCVLFCEFATLAIIVTSSTFMCLQWVKVSHLKDGRTTLKPFRWQWCVAIDCQRKRWPTPMEWDTGWSQTCWVARKRRRTMRESHRNQCESLWSWGWTESWTRWHPASTTDRKERAVEQRTVRWTHRRQCGMVAFREHGTDARSQDGLSVCKLGRLLIKKGL